MRTPIRKLLLVLSLIAAYGPAVYAATSETTTIPTEDTVAGAALEDVADNADVEEPAARLPAAAITVVAGVAILVVSLAAFFSLRGRRKR